jgi:hypothetical protein
MLVKEKYVVLNYAPEEENKYIMNGPIHITGGFPVFSKTIFENGIDCAFDIEDDDNEAFIFSGNQCAQIKYARYSLKIRFDYDRTFHSLICYFNELVF